jgi:hypothetical protein
VDRWFEGILATYPAETAKYLRSETDRFQNPVGRTIAPAIAQLFDALVAGENTDRLASCLEDIIRIRAVQDFSPAEAVGFVFQLKGAIRRELGSDPENGLGKDLRSLDRRIDQAILLAFNTYVACREQLFQIRTKEIQRRTAAILRRHNYVVGDEGPEQAPEADR